MDHGPGFRNGGGFWRRGFVCNLVLWRRFTRVVRRETSVSGEAEYSSSVYSSEVVSAVIRLCFSSLCIFICARVEHSSGLLVDTPFLRFHCTSGLGISRLLDKGVRLMLLGLSHWRHAMQTYHQMTSTHECNNQQITVALSTRDGQIPDT